MNAIEWKIAFGALLLAIVALTWSVFPTFSSDVPFLTNGGIGYDPLTQDETDRVLALALESDEAQQAQKRIAAALRPLEVLSIERHDAPKDAVSAAKAERRGEVYFYDYSTDTLIHSTVNVTTGEIAVERYQNVQLPLTENEEQRAVELVQADAPLWAELGEDYQAITGQPLASLDQLQVKVSLFLAEAMPDQVNAAAQQCGLHRCAQVLLFTVDRTVLEVLPIVDLSKGQVIQLLSDSWTGAS